jgi:hypothetical protein
MTPLDAALLASAITAAASLGVAWVTQRLKDGAASRSRRLQAYLDVLSLAVAVRLKASAYGIAMQPGSGLHPGLATAEGLFKMIDWLEAEFELMRAATVRFWVGGSVEAVVLANTILDLCSGLNELAMKNTDAEGRAAWDAEIHRLADLRAKFANVARKDLKQKAIDLQALHGSTDEPKLSDGSG